MEEEIEMAKFQVELKKVVDDSYEIEIGHGLAEKLVEDIRMICLCLRREKRVRHGRQKHRLRTPCLKKAIGVTAVSSLWAEVW